MRKWMKDRLQRRKKKAPEQGSQPAPPPLQPAYFDAEQAPSPVSQASDVETRRTEPSQRASEESVLPDAEAEEQPVREESAGGTAPSRPSAARGEGQRGRGRRRRGGRGRGGRGREQAVAQAFTPAAAKGIVPVLPDSEVPAEEGAAEAETPDTGTLEATEPQAHPVPQAPHIPAAIPTAPPRPPKGIVVLAIGLPGSGKEFVVQAS